MFLKLKYNYNYNIYTITKVYIRISGDANHFHGTGGHL